ncbi:ABC transporter ATP-binding protein, partial [Neisseria gonorrhoeae]
LILDEPTASLSSRESLRLYDLVRGLKQRGISVLYISHRTADLAALADRVEILRGGRNVGSFTQPIDFDAAIETMIGRSLSSARPDRRETFGKTVLDLQNVRLLPGAKPFSLSVREGEVVAITGVLGAGKSRLLSSLFGLGAFAEGTASLDG